MNTSYTLGFTQFNRVYCTVALEVALCDDVDVMVDDGDVAVNDGDVTVNALIHRLMTHI